MEIMQILYISITYFTITVLNVCDPGDILVVPGYEKQLISGQQQQLIGLMAGLLT